VKQAPKEVARKAHKGLDLSKDYLRSLYKTYKDGGPFGNVETYCMFVGYPKSGHSLIGALLDAHPEAIIAHELDALSYLRTGLGKKQLFYLLLENSREHARAGRGWSGYSYEVPNQWQGRFENLRVIGDKKAGISSYRLASKPALLDRLRETVGVPVKLVHVIRNPYDNISTMLRDGVDNRNMQGRQGLRNCIEGYFSKCVAVRDLKDRTGADVFDVRHESFVEDPVRHLGDLCDFLGLKGLDDYLNDCASIIFESPNKSRHKVEWDPESIEIVKSRMGEFDFLRGYSYED
jgi:hypothetical protein